MSKSIHTELFRITAPPVHFIFILILLVVVSPMIVDQYNSGYTGLTIVTVIAMILAIIFLLNQDKVHGAKRYKKQQKLYKAQELTTDLTIFEDCIVMKEILNQNESNSSSYSRNAFELTFHHDKITKVYQSKNIFVLVYGKYKKVSFVIDKNTFTLGTPEAFEQFLLAKGVKIKQKK